MNPYSSVVITGAHGMLGHALTDGLHARGIKPVTLPRAQCDLADPSHVQKLFEHHPTLVLNCAAHTKVDQAEQEPALADRINGTAVGELAAGCKKTGAMLVHVSTDFVFNGQGTRPYKIDDPVAPLSAYGRSKLLGETELKRNAPARWLIVRTAWVFGRHGNNFPRTMVTVAKDGKPLTVITDQIGSPTYTDDLAAGILALIDRNANGTFAFTNSGQTNWNEFARTTLKAFGIDHSVGETTADAWAKLKPTAAIRPRFSAMDLTPFAAAAGYTPRHWTEALNDYQKRVDEVGF